MYASVRNVLTKQALDIGANVGALAFVYTACRALVLSLVARRYLQQQQCIPRTHVLRAWYRNTGSAMYVNTLREPSLLSTLLHLELAILCSLA